MKLAVVVQRYGPDINGGAELLARYLAERFARYADVQVLTTCAKDYVTWRNEFPAGEERINNILGAALSRVAAAERARLRIPVALGVRTPALGR